MKLRPILYLIVSAIMLLHVSAETEDFDDRENAIMADYEENYTRTQPIASKDQDILNFVKKILKTAQSSTSALIKRIQYQTEKRKKFAQHINDALLKATDEGQLH